MSAAVSNGREPPKLWISFPTTRYYMNQLRHNPNLAFKTFMHKTMPFAFKDPKKTRKNVEALKAKGRKAAGVRTYKFKYFSKKHIATGGFGKIYIAKCLLKAGTFGTITETCALKVIPLKRKGFWSKVLGQRSGITVDNDAAMNELIILKNLQGNEFIMEYKYDTLKHGRLIIVTEYCSGKDLADILENSQKLPSHYFVPGSQDETNRIPCNIVRLIMAPIFDALVHMHGKGYIHRDIKPQNILVDERMTPKLCDFGLAVYMDKKKGICPADENMSGSSYYMAPESACRKPFTATLDTWQMGITMLVLSYGWSPYHFMKRKVHWEERKQHDTSAVCYFYRNTYYTKNERNSAVNKHIRSLLGIRKRDVLLSEEDRAWAKFKYFVGAIMKFHIGERPSCASILQHEYIAEPLREWKNRQFNTFGRDFYEWQKIVEAA